MAVDVVDLQLVQANLDTIKRVLEQHPEARGRTAAFLAGELEGMEAEDMARKHDDDDEGMLQQVGLRLTPEMVQRVDALIPWLESQPALQALGRKVTRSTAARYAMGRGLLLLEAEAAGREHKGK